MMAKHLSIFYGAVINPVSLTKYNASPTCLLAVGPDGTVIWIVEDVPEHLIQDTLAQKGLIGVEIVTLKDGEFIIPGFIDTHTHAPQFPNIGSGQEYELLDWLENVTFPMEKRFADLDFARRTYNIVVRRTIDLGTTTCCYYGSLHLDATKALADITHAYGQRAFVGKCNMDWSPNPAEDYIEPSAQESIETTVELIEYIRSLHSKSDKLCPPTTGPLVKPILTPRFALSCSRELFTCLCKLAAADPSLHIQTHISENLKEIEDVRRAFPDAPHYAGVYDMYHLLRRNTVLGHGVHLEDAEIDLIRERHAGISHCPVSNFNLRSGVAPIGKYLDKGLKVGLGTDVSGGFSPSMLTVVQQASIAAKVCAFRSEGNDANDEFANHPLPVATLFYLATMGGARVCDIEKQVGSFAPGKSFDALLASVRPETGNHIVWSDDVGHHGDYGKPDPKKLLDHYLERFLFGGDDRNILRVYVQGRFVGGKSFKASQLAPET